MEERHITQHQGCGPQSRLNDLPVQEELDSISTKHNPQLLTEEANVSPMISSMYDTTALRLYWFDRNKHFQDVPCLSPNDP